MAARLLKSCIGGGAREEKKRKILEKFFEVKLKKIPEILVTMEGHTEYQMSFCSISVSW